MKSIRIVLRYSPGSSMSSSVVSPASVSPWDRRGPSGDTLRLGGGRGEGADEVVVEAVVVMEMPSAGEEGAWEVVGRGRSTSPLRKLSESSVGSCRQRGEG
jgi:hypothetical protein